MIRPREFGGEPRRVFGGLIAPELPALTDDEIAALRARTAAALLGSEVAEMQARDLARVLDALDLALAELRELQKLVRAEPPARPF